MEAATRIGGGGEIDRLRGLSPKEAATAVEGVFVSMLVSEMKKTLHEGGFFGNAPGSQVFDGMFDRMMGEEIARKGGLGLADFVQEQMRIRNEQAADQAPNGKAEVEGTARP